MNDETAERQARLLASLSAPAEPAAETVTENEAETDPAEALALQRIGTLLAHPGTWQEAPALPAALLAEIRAESAKPARASAATPAPATVAPTPVTTPATTVTPAPVTTPATTATPASATAPATTATPAPAATPEGPAGEPPPADSPVGKSPVEAPAAEPPSARLPAADPPARRRLRWSWPRPTLGLAVGLAAALLAVVMLGGDLWKSSDDPAPTTAQLQLAGTSTAPGARATVQVIERAAGWRLVLNIEGLAPAAPNDYYEGWAVRGDQYVPLGTFHMHQQGQVELWSGVPLKEFSRIEVTSQRVGDGLTPGQQVMVGQM